MMDFVDERLAPADDVPRRPPELPEGMIGLGYEHGLEPARAVAVGPEDLELVELLHVECDRALAAVDLPLESVAPAEGEARRLDRAHCTRLELDGRLDRIVDLAAREERVDERRDGRDVADEETREVDHVRTEVAERPRAGRACVEAPGVQRRIVTPVLQVAAAE